MDSPHIGVLFALASFHAKHFMVLSQCFAHMQFNTYLISNGLHETIQREKFCVIMRLLMTHFQMFLLICQFRDFWQCGDHSARACFAVRCLVSVCFSSVSLFSSSDPREKITFVVGVFSWGWGEGGDCHFGRGLWDFLQSCGPILHLRCLGCYFWISASVSRASNLHKVVPEVLCFKVT